MTTNTNTFTTETKFIAALLHLAARKDLRYWLNSIHVTPNYLEACDGSLAARITTQTGLPEGTDLILDGESLKNILAILKKQKWTTFEMVEGRVNTPMGWMDCKLVDGHFPDLDQVIPKSTLGEPGQFDVELLGKFAKANKEFGAKSPGRIKLEHNGTFGAAIVKLCAEEFTGVIMPIRP